MSTTHNTYPMDPVLRARLNLPCNARLRLKTLRGALLTLDTLSRITTGKPFFALRDSEALMEQIADMSGIDRVQHILAFGSQTELTTHGLSHVPTSGPVILAATHPTGMFDYLAHAGALARLRTDLKVVATAEALQFLGPEAVIPVQVDKSYRSTASRQTLQDMRHHLDSGGALLVFGSGRVSHRSGGQLVERDWRSGPTRVSRFCNAPLIPAAIDACNSSYYYRMRGLAQFLSRNEHFGAMTGSVRHAAELLEKLGRRFEIHYGKPLPPGTSPQILKSAAEGLVPGLYAA